MATITILSPVAQPAAAVRVQAERRAFSQIKGKVLGVLSNGWRSFHSLADIYEGMALNSYGATRVVKRKYEDPAGQAPTIFIQELGGADAAIVGLGH